MIGAVRLVRAVGLASMLTGCAAAPQVNGGTVMMTSDASEAHVRMGENAGAVGDRVVILRKRCAIFGNTGQCKTEPVGEAEVTRLLNPHDAVVRALPGVVVEEGDRVEKPSCPARADRP